MQNITEQLISLMDAEARKDWNAVEAIKADIKQAVAEQGKPSVQELSSIPGVPFAKASFYLVAATK